MFEIFWLEFFWKLHLRVLKGWQYIRKKNRISTRAFQWVEIANNVENCHFWSTYHNRSFSTVFCIFLKSPDLNRLLTADEVTWGLLQPIYIVYARRLSEAHFPEHSKIFVALMITPTLFIDKKIFFNQVQNWNLDNISFTLISLNLIFCLLIWPKSTITRRCRFFVLPMGVKQVSPTRLVLNHFWYIHNPEIYHVWFFRFKIGQNDTKITNHRHQ